MNATPLLDSMRHALVILGLAAASTAHAGTLTVEVENNRSGKGVVRIDVCRENAFLTDKCAWHALAPAHPGTTVVTVTGLPAGHYAAQASLDENDNDHLDQGLFGMPKEGIGFSNNARIGLSAPKFAAAQFAFDGETRTIAIRLRYFLGKKGPLDEQR
jgi:uncharacterized protein (DUF2141 family)